MRQFPFISRRSHDAIVAAKDAQIAMLNDQTAFVKTLEDRSRLDAIALHDKLVDALRVRIAPEVPRRRRQPEEEETKAPETLDLAMVDPSDNDALILIAKREIPPGTRISASALVRTVEKLREQVIEAHTSRMRSASTPGYVPTALAERIAAADRAGIEAAQLEVGV